MTKHELHQISKVFKDEIKVTLNEALNSFRKQFWLDFATEISKLATKSDLENLATKDDLNTRLADYTGAIADLTVKGQYQDELIVPTLQTHEQRILALEEYRRKYCNRTE